MGAKRHVGNDAVVRALRLAGGASYAQCRVPNLGVRMTRCLSGFKERRSYHTTWPLEAWLTERENCPRPRPWIAEVEGSLQHVSKASDSPRRTVSRVGERSPGATSFLPRISN